MPSQTFSINEKSLFIRAGAGAGKTTQLIKSFTEFAMEFKEKHKRFPKVVITTFTRKATQEVKERLLVSALKQNNQELFEYINKKSSVHISTIHGLLSLYLMQNADYLSLPQQLQVVDSFKAKKNLKKNIYQFFKKNSQYIDLLEQMSFSQLIDISTLALDYLSQSPDLKPTSEQLLVQISLNKMSEIRNHIDHIFELVSSCPDNWTEYFDYVKNYRDKINSFLTQNECPSRTQLSIYDLEPDKPRFLSKKPVFSIEAHDLIELIRKDLKLELCDTKEFIQQHQQVNQLFFNFISELNQIQILHRQKTGELTISDLENESLRLMRQSPESLASFSNSWDYFMVDEYQDTSPIQVEILNLMVADKPFFIVGDPQQSIYLFRGARSEVFTNKENEVKNQGGQILQLATNYRSDSNLMKFINHFFGEFSSQFSSMSPKQDVEKTDSVQAFYIQTQNEVLSTLKQIQNLLSLGVKEKQICVLSRKHSILVEISQKAYHYNISVQLQTSSKFESKREIQDLVFFLKFLVNPHNDENLIGLLRSPWLHLPDQDILNLTHAKGESTDSLWDKLRESEQVQLKQKIFYYLELFDSFGCSYALHKFIIETGFLNTSELLDPSGKREANIWKFLNNLIQSEKKSGFLLASFLEEQFQSLQSDLGQATNEAQPVVQPDSVSLMTIHASKGLEFDYVIIVGFTDQPQLTKVMPLAYDPETQMMSLPIYDEEESKNISSAWSINLRHKFNLREKLENERLLYVAMTRAKKSLSLVAESIAEKDKRKVIASESWFKKTNWPTGDLEGHDFSIKIIQDESAELFKETKSVLKMIDVRPLFQQSLQTKLAETVSVTDILSKQKNSSSDFQHDQIISNLKKAQQGTVLHQFFESLKYLDWESSVQLVSSQQNRSIQFLKNQKQLPIFEILQKGFTEWGFGLKTKKGRMQGQIDLWAELHTDIHVIDYKTGSSKYVDKAYTQLSLYTAALLQMNKIAKNKKIIHSVIYSAEEVILQKAYSNSDIFFLENSELQKIFSVDESLKDSR